MTRPTELPSCSGLRKLWGEVRLGQFSPQEEQSLLQLVLILKPLSYAANAAKTQCVYYIPTGN